MLVRATDYFAIGFCVASISTTACFSRSTTHPDADALTDASRDTQSDEAASAATDAADATDAPVAPSIHPRLIAPLSTSRTSRRPTFRWTLPDGISTARIELCGDRACAAPVVTADVSGSTWTPTVPLPPGIVLWRVRGMASDGTPSAPSATWVVHVETALVGQTRTPVPDDFNGDGFSDVLVGDTELPIDPAGYVLGSVYAFSGGAGGIDSAPVVLGRPDSVRCCWGLWVSGAGDVNGDGFADAIVGMAGQAAYVYLGSPTGLTTTFATAVPLVDPAAGLSSNAIGAGDVNGDGFDDVVMPFSTAPAGGRYSVGIAVYMGSATGLATTPSAMLQSDLGRAALDVSTCARVGDVNGDGFDDIAVLTTGPFFVVYRGGPAGLGATPPDMIPSANSMATSYAFHSVGPAGDLNGDGFDDVVFGVPEVNRAYVYLGSSAGLVAATTMTLGTGRNFNRNAGLAGDLDGDGLGDLMMGEVSALTVYRGSPSGLTSMPWVTPGQADGGYTVDDAASPTLVLDPPPTTDTPQFTPLGRGDFDGDGFGDLVMRFEDMGHLSLLLYRGGPSLVGMTPSETIVVR